MANRVGQQLGNYRLIGLLGQGSFAEVYLGEHLYLKTEAAVKVLHMQLTDSDAESFLNEAQTVARLVHQHIVRIFDFNVHDGTPFVVMDYAPNGTLRQRHPRARAVPLHLVLNYVKQIADALQYAHDQKLIHRDIKPENMLLGRRSEVLLSDFGIAQAAQSTILEKTQPMAGTVAYMSPEQLQGRARYASDQYALGIAVYEWLSGDRPFQGSFTELVSQHLFVSPLPLHEKVPGIPPAVEEVVMVALSKDFRQRFASVQAFANALEQACYSTPSFRPVSAYAPPTPVLPLLSSPPSTDVNQPAQVQQQLPLTPTPPAPSIPPVMPSATLQPAQVQQPLASSPQPSVQQPVSTEHGKQQQPQKNLVRSVLLIASVILVIAGSLTTYFVFFHKPSTTAPPPIVNGIGVSKAPDGEYIGISDGTFAFDTNRPDGALKLQAADRLEGSRYQWCRITLAVGTRAGNE